MTATASPRREEFEWEGARGFRYSKLDEDLLSHLTRWLATGRVDEGEMIRAERLYRYGNAMVKFYSPGTRLRDRLRRNPALRAADLHEKLLPIRTPQPILALEGCIAGRDRSSLLVYQFVEGKHLTDLWGKDEAAVHAFPRFLADMHRAGVFHGDFHLHNALSDEQGWVLIDVDGIRHKLRTLLPRRLGIGHWSRVLYALAYHCGASDDEVRPLFEIYAAELPLSDREASWKQICARASAYLASTPRP